MAYGQQYSNPYMYAQPNYGGYPNAAYPNGYSGGYQQMPPATANNQPMQNYGMMQSYQAPQQIATTMAFVNGDIEARAYAVAPGNRVYLFDMDGRTFYSKGVDHNGMPLPFKKYDYTEVVEAIPEISQNYSGQMHETPQQQINLDEYIRRDEVETMIAQEVEKRISAMNTATNAKTGAAKKGADANA